MFRRFDDVVDVAGDATMTMSTITLSSTSLQRYRRHDDVDVRSSIIDYDGRHRRRQYPLLLVLASV